MAQTASAWTDLPQLPEAMAGQCAGVSSGWLLVAGGSMWSAPPWAGGVKTWSDRVYGLQTGSTAWRVLGRLPAALAYGAAAQAGNSMLCAGGQNATEVFRSVFRLEMDQEGKLHVTELPPLLEPLTNAAAAVAADQLFLFGGQRSLLPGDTAKHGLQLPLQGGHAWQTLRTPWDHARILPAVAGCNGSVYVGGGADLSAVADGSPVRQYLQDAWRFDTGTAHWTSLPALPAAVTAAPSACSPQGDWLIFGGDDGSLAPQIQQLRDAHPGFRKQVLVYDAAARHWSGAGNLPLSLVTTGAALWNGHYVIAGGENQPGHRSQRVLQGEISKMR